MSHPLVRKFRRREILDTETSVYVGRPSRWGNPYSHQRGTLAKFRVASREEAVAKFEEHLLASPELLAALPELRGKFLICWCAPLACHGDVLARMANA